jgi:exopolyphosphatase/pppGpp-phosphohydrolase
VRLSYAAIRERAPAATRIVLLHIGEEGTSVAAGMGIEPDQVLTLNIGSSRIAACFFQHNPPAPIEIEDAIMVVEDEVKRACELAAGYPSLYSTDEVIHDIARTAGCPHEPTILLTVERVERLFDQLAARSEGRPSSQVAVPDDTQFSATLLILREFMHHLRFDEITLVREPASTGSANSP